MLEPWLRLQFKERKREADKSKLKGQRFRHLQTMVNTTTKLQHDPQASIQAIVEKMNQNDLELS